jgi:putative transposase
MIKKRAFKYRLRPTKNQREKFQQFAGVRRWIFNQGLEQRQKAHQEERKLSYYEQNNELIALKEQFPWLQEVHSQVHQQALKDLDRAYQHFFRRIKLGEKPGFPKFKKKGVKDTFRFPQGVRVKGSHAYLPKIGKVKFRKSRENEGVLKETTIIQEGNGWSIAFSCEIEAPAPLPAPIDEGKAVGIDMGLRGCSLINF